MRVDLVRRAWEAIDFRTPLVVRALADAGVFAALAEGAATTAHLASACSLHAGSLDRALQLLIAADVVRSHGEAWEFTDVGRMLRPGDPSGAGDMAVFFPWELAGWSEVSHVLATGEPGFVRATGQTPFEWFATYPDAGRRFDVLMQRRTTGLLAHGLALYDGWPEQGTVVDVGGGNGTLLGHLLGRRPGLRGVLFDRPGVVAGAPGVLDAAGVSNRVDVVAGDFFDSVPPGGDLYILGSVLHDWDDHDAGRILTTVRAACQATSRLLLFEAALRTDGQPDPMRMIDIHMLVMLGGGERTVDAWRTLLEQHDFSHTRVVPGPTLSWIEAEPTAR